MSDADRAQHDFEKIFLTSFEHRHLRSNRREQFPIDRAALFDAEDIDAHASLEEILVRLDHIRFAPHVGHTRVCGGKQMIMDREHVRVIEEFRAEIARGLQRHVTARAIELGLLRIIKAARAVA